MQTVTTTKKTDLEDTFLVLDERHMHDERLGGYLIVTRHSLRVNLEFFEVLRTVFKCHLPKILLTLIIQSIQTSITPHEPVRTSPRPMCVVCSTTNQMAVHNEQSTCVCCVFNYKSKSHTHTFTGSYFAAAYVCCVFNY